MIQEDMIPEEINHNQSLTRYLNIENFDFVKSSRRIK